MYEGSRTPFTYKTILRDLLARQCTLNAGAQHIRELTALYSSTREKTFVKEQL